MSEQPRDTRGMDPDDATTNPEFGRMLERVFAEADRSAPPRTPTREAYRDESDQLYVGREFTSVADFARWYGVQRLGRRPFNAVGFHHTAVPSTHVWAGMPTLTGIYNYYHNDLGWRPWGLGPHLWVYSGDGPWRHGTPHIYVGTHPAVDGAGIIDRNQCWLHIEHVWDGDADPFSEAMVRVAGQVLAIVCSRHRHADREIPLTFIRDGGVDNPGRPLGIMYHRDQNPNWVPGAWPKSCPGLQVTHDNLDPDVLRVARRHSPWQWADQGGGGDPVAEVGALVAVRGATVRRRPSRDGEEIGRLDEGQRYPTDAYTDRGEAIEGSSRWYRLASDASWVHSSGGAYTAGA